MYKKLLLVFVSAITIKSVKAQTEKGSQMLGASFGVSTSSSNLQSFNASTNIYDPNVHGKANFFNIAPSYSYFIADKLDLGASVGYGNSSQDYSGPYNPQSTKSHAFNSSIFLRKYFLYDNKIGIRTGPYFSYSSGYQEATYQSEPVVYKYRSDVYYGGVSLDFIYFPVKRLGLAAALGNATYSHQKSKESTQGSSNGFGINFANSLTLSVNYVFGN
jgi:hypothetical protein